MFIKKKIFFIILFFFFTRLQLTLQIYQKWNLTKYCSDVGQVIIIQYSLKVLISKVKNATSVMINTREILRYLKNIIYKFQTQYVLFSSTLFFIYWFNVNPKELRHKFHIKCQHKSIRLIKLNLIELAKPMNPKKDF